MRWSRPDTTPERFAGDSDSCRAQALRKLNTAEKVLLYPLIAPLWTSKHLPDEIFNKDFYKACMAGQGYVPNSKGWRSCFDVDSTPMMDPSTFFSSSWKYRSKQDTCYKERLSP